MKKKLSEAERKKELERLLKLKEEVVLRIEKRKKETAALEKKIQTYEKNNKLLFFGHEGKGYLGRQGSWEPNSIQKQLFKALKNPQYKHFVLYGSNRISKTFSTTGVIALLAMRGHFPWEDPEIVGRWFWEMHDWEPPIKIRIVGQAWESHIKGTILATIKELWPESYKITSRKNNLGVDAFWTDSLTKSTVEIMSNKSESDMFEGSSQHLCLFDEPPREDVWTACVRGLVDHNGIAVYAATLLKEPFLEERIIEMTDPETGLPDPSVFSVFGTMDDNKGHGISQEGIDNFKKGLSKEEYDRRVLGKTAFRSGLLLNIDKSLHYIERFKIESHVLVDVAIDIGFSKGMHILYLATNQLGCKFVCFEELVLGDGTAIAESIIAKKHRYNLRINRVICDPLAKGDKTNFHSTWEKIDIALNRHEMYLEPGSKDKDDGIIAINNLLMTVNKMPALFVFRDLPIATKQLYGWRQEDGVISKKDDDMCENLYRLILLGTEYEEPRNPDFFYSGLSGNRDSVTGY